MLLRPTVPVPAGIYLRVLRGTDSPGTARFKEIQAMTFETLTPALLSLIIGWTARHYGLLAPASPSPQTASGQGGTVPPGPVSATIVSEIDRIVNLAIEKAVARIEARLLPQQTTGGTPQT